MRIVHIKTIKSVKKTKKEYSRDLELYGDDNMSGLLYVSRYKEVPCKEPIYIVEMSAKEIQLVSFYLELENRKPIMNVEVKAEIKKGNKL